MGVDLNRIAAAAVEAFLKDEGQASGRSNGGHRRLGGAGAIALGAGLAIAARFAYDRARSIDLERVAGAVEDKLSG